MRHFYARGSSQFQNLRPECGCIHFSFEVQNRSRSWEKWETSSLRRDNLLATPPWCLVCGGNNLCGVETLNNWRRELTHTRVVKSKNLPGLSNRPESGPLRYIAIITEWVWVNYNYQHWSVSAINDEPRCPHRWMSQAPCHGGNSSPRMSWDQAVGAMSSKLVSISSSLMCIRFKSIFGSLTLGLVATFLTWVSLACALCSPVPIPLTEY